MIIIKPEGGLCNYLRFMFSYYEYARSINEQLIVIWEKTEKCPGYFLDYFEDIPNITFLSENPSNDTIIDFIGDKPHPDYDIYSRDIECKYGGWNNLNLNPFMKKEIEAKKNILGDNYISIHIRRTDHIELAKKHDQYTSDKEFFNFIDKHEIVNIYIATDDKETYYEFKKIYPNQIKFNYHKTNNGCLRQTSLQDAIIDMYVCSFSKDFMGSGRSSFSTVIKRIRGSRK